MAILKKVKKFDSGYNLSNCDSARVMIKAPAGSYQQAWADTVFACANAEFIVAADAVGAKAKEQLRGLGLVV